MPAWIHGRAEHILAKNPSMSKGEAFAIATQQSHAVGKSPKGYGTLQGRETAKAKYDTPKDDKKTANPGGLRSEKMDKSAGFMDSVKSALTTPIAGTPELFSGVKSGINQATRFGGSAGGPSEGFKKFQQQMQQQRSKMAAFADELEQMKVAGSLGPAMNALAQSAPAMTAAAPRAGGMNMMFMPKAPPPSMPMAQGTRA